MEEKIKELLEKKSNEVLNDSDKRKLSLVEVMLADANWYNKVDPNTAINILMFLGLPIDTAKDCYFKLISIENNINNRYDKYALFDNEIFKK